MMKIRFQMVGLIDRYEALRQIEKENQKGKVLELKKWSF
jgi:hypothetical protein